MLPRPSPLPPPEGPRFWVVDLVGKGQHHFRHPYYGVGAALLGAMLPLARDESVEDTRSIQAKSADLLPVAGMVIGACWHHRAMQLKTLFPLSDLSEKSLLQYGASVAEELQDEGYNILDILDLFGQVTPELNKRQSILVMAQERAAFSVAPVVG